MKQILILGGGLIGSAIARNLLRDRDLKVLVADRDSDTCELLTEKYGIDSVDLDVNNSKAFARLVNAATGWDLTGDQLLLTGERLFNLKRVINNRLGVTRADDSLPRRLLTQARPSGTAEGKLPNLGPILDEYYKVRGWLPDGRPSQELLGKLGLAII